MAFDKTAALEDIERVLGRAPQAGDRDAGAKQERSATMVACIERWTPPGHAILRKARELFDGKYGLSEHLFEALLQALKADIEADRLQTFAEVVHAELFSDFLSQAEHLNSEGYWLPAAVLAGATLEEHLRQLANRHNVALTTQRGRPVKASKLNADLYATAHVYSKSKQAQVDSWQKCRNDAAHGDANFNSNFTEADIRRMIEGVRDFIVKYPA